MSRRARRALFTAATLGALAAPRPSRALTDAQPNLPQFNAAYTTGYCALGSDGDPFEEGAWCNGLRADVLLGRARNSDWALGPYARVSSADFWDVRYGAGVSVLWPGGDFPFVLSLGAGGHELDAVALESWLFWGTRSYNFHGTYSLSAGVLVGASRDLDARGRSELFFGGQIDALILALPFLLMVEAAR